MAGPERQDLDRIHFDFIRSPFFRVVHSNGAWGGITPKGELSVTFYSERGALPRRITHELTSDGLGQEIDRDHAIAVERECEVEILMNLQEAVNLHEWIGGHLKALQELDSSSQEDLEEAS